ncbi:MAG: hypothetical protein ACK41P_11395, partial [Asticcacaulis sp.]
MVFAAFLILACVCWPATAHADPVTTAVVAAIGLKGVAATVATFLINTALSLGLSRALAPKAPKAGAQERQAALLQLSLGEGTRTALFGRVLVAGHLVRSANYGGKDGTDWVVMLIRIADHACDGLEGVWVNDAYYDWRAGLWPEFKNQLHTVFLPGTLDQQIPEEFKGPLGLGPDDNLRGMAGVIVAFKADAPDSREPVWPGGAPAFIWRV